MNNGVQHLSSSQFSSCYHSRRIRHSPLHLPRRWSAGVLQGIRAGLRQARPAHRPHIPLLGAAQEKLWTCEAGDIWKLTKVEAGEEYRVTLVVRDYISLGGSVHQDFFAGFFVRSLFVKNSGSFCTMWTEQHFVGGFFVSFFVILQCGKDVVENWPKNSQGQDRCRESFGRSEKSAQKCTKRILTKKPAKKPHKVC